MFNTRSNQTSAAPQSALPQARLLSTGELASACGVSVRTVQYYDQRELLHPAERTQGGRRLYDQAALERLQTICTLKELGMSLVTIRGVLDESDDAQALLGILNEQELVLQATLAQNEAMLSKLRALQAAYTKTAATPGVPATSGARSSKGSVQTGTQHSTNPASQLEETIMHASTPTTKTKLQAHFRKMLLEGGALSLVWIVTLVYGFAYGRWEAAIAVLPLALVIAGELAYMYWRDARYVCPSCHEVFQPKPAEFIFARHSPKARKLTCTHCHTKSWCAEKSVETVAQPQR